MESEAVKSFKRPAAGYPAVAFSPTVLPNSGSEGLPAFSTYSDSVSSVQILSRSMKAALKVRDSFATAWDWAHFIFYRRMRLTLFYLMQSLVDIPFPSPDEFASSSCATECSGKCKKSVSGPWREAKTSYKVWKESFPYLEDRGKKKRHCRIDVVHIWKQCLKCWVPLLEMLKEINFCF